MNGEARGEQPAAGDQLWDLLNTELYTPEEAARVLNLREDLILRAAFGGDLKATIINGDVISITRTDLVAWLKWREGH